MTKFIAEIAGKDSVSAIHRFARTHAYEDIVIIPTIAYTGTEYGRFESYIESVDFLKRDLKKYGITFEDVYKLHDEKLWNILNAKYQYLIYKKYNFFTPCIMCHFYTHLIRVPLYMKNEAKGIITGERLSHDGKIKLNQHQLTIDSFTEIFQKNAVMLIQPNLNIQNTTIIDEEIDNNKIVAKSNDVKCVLSGNLYGYDSMSDIFYSELNSYINTFVKPIGNFCLESIIKNGYVELDVLEKEIEGILYA